MSDVVRALVVLQLDPRDLDHSYLGRDHFNKIFDETDSGKFVVSLGDLGESKDCTGSGSLFAGTTECFELSRDFLGGFGAPFDVVGGNHDLEGIGATPHTRLWPQPVSRALR